MKKLAITFWLLLFITTATYGSIDSRPFIDYAPPLIVASGGGPEPPEIDVDDRFIRLQEPASRCNGYDLLAIVLLFGAYMVVIARQLL